MIRAWCCIVLASIALAINAGAAQANDEIGLSLDGRTWTDNIDRPLFDPHMRWVPGDVETRSFWVRNEGPTKAAMKVGVRTTDPDELFARDDILIDARVRGGKWAALPHGGDHLTLTKHTLAKGGRVRVDLRVAFAPEATDRTEHAELPLRFVVRLTQAGPGNGPGGNGPGDNGPGDDGYGGLLPDTGAAVEPWLLWLAGGLLGGGALILTARRRKEHSDA